MHFISSHGTTLSSIINWWVYNIDVIFVVKVLLIWQELISKFEIINQLRFGRKNIVNKM